MKTSIFCVLLTAFAHRTTAHFTLYTPTAIGANVAGGGEEGTGPCGSFDIKNRDSVAEWPVAGYPVYMITTHPKAVFEFRAALLNDTNTWINVVPPIAQDGGVGFFCEGAMPGFGPWDGLDVVLQVAQFAPDGINYQCAAIKFVDGPAAAIGGCKNSSGISAAFDVSFTSTLPYGSVITLTNTGVPTNTAAGNPTVTTGASNTSVTTGSKTGSSTGTASTTKAGSGAVLVPQTKVYTVMLVILAVFSIWVL